MRVEGNNVSNTGRSLENNTNTQHKTNNTSGSRTREYLREDLLDHDVSDKLEEEIEREIERLNKTVRTYDRKLNFELHRETDRYFVQVIDVIDDEIIREIPPEEILDLVARIDHMLGIIIDEKI